MKFVCTKCGRTEPVTTRNAHCSCGGLWKLDFTPEKFELSGIDTHEWSQFRYRRYMALDGESWRGVTLGEGMTPVVTFDEDVSFKMDYFMPTLSFKDRGAAVLIAHCKAIGVDRVVQDSSGNAGNAVAAYCAKAGIGCEIFVPEGTSPKKIDMIRAHGAICTVVPGSRDHCADVCREKVEKEGVYYANHVYNPFFYEGTKTYIYEVFEQLGRIPANLVIPVGNGTLFLGAIFALEHLQESGVIDRFPQIIALQSQNCDPLLRAAEENLDTPAAVHCRGHLHRKADARAGNSLARQKAQRPLRPRAGGQNSRCARRNCAQGHLLRAHHRRQLRRVSGILPALRQNPRHVNHHVWCRLKIRPLKSRTTPRDRKISDRAVLYLFLFLRKQFLFVPEVIAIAGEIGKHPADRNRDPDTDLADGSCQKIRQHHARAE